MRRPPNSLWLALLLLVPALVPALLLVAPATARTGGGPILDDAPPPVRTALLEGQYVKALELVDGLAQAQPERADFWLILRGTTLLALNRAEDAATAFASLESRHPQSPWRIKARLDRAEALRRLRRYAEAEAIVATEATQLLSDDRRRELVQLVVTLGDARMEPPKEPATPTNQADPAKAAELFRKALELEPPAELADAVRLKLGFALAQAGQHADAVAALRTFLDQHGAKDDLDAARAQMTLGLTLLLGENLHAAARRVFEDLSAALATTTDAERVKLRGDALYALADTWPGPVDPAGRKEVTALQRYLEQCPRHTKSWAASLRIALLHVTHKDPEEALKSLDWLLARPDEGITPAEREEALRTKAEAAFLRGAALITLQRPQEAATAFADCIARDPSGPRWADAQKEIVNAELAVATVAEHRHDFAGARAALQAFIDAHPLDERVAELRYEIGNLFGKEARRLLAEAETPVPGPTVARVRELWLQNAEEWKRIARTHPGAHFSFKALYDAGVVYEEQLGELEKAVEAYKACTSDDWKPEVAARLEAMSTPTLALGTERSFRTSEPARVRLSTRNLKKVRIEIHPLDLRAYFLKHLAFTNVEDLDLDLVAPKQMLDVELKDYARWKPLAQEVEIPLEGAGACVVTAVAEGMRATTLLLRTDLDIVVKSSRQDLLVFAQDRAKNTPAAGVSLLLDFDQVDGSGTARRQATATTGDDGIFHLRLERPLSEGRVRVFASRAGDCASTGLSVSGMYAAAPITPRGVVFTDRPAYKPGDAVHVRALLREVRDGRLSVEAGSTWQLELIDARGQAVHTAALRLSEFGTLHAETPLDAFAPVGTWRARVSRTNGPSFESTFEVANYELDRITLDLTVARPIVYRGEPIELTALARHHWGAPLADAALTFTLPDGRVVEMRTDGSGSARTTFDTRDQEAAATLTFKAALPEESITSATNARVALEEFALRLDLGRSLLLAGETFPATVRAERPDGASLAQDVALKVRRTVKGGHTTVLERTLRTTERDGATIDLALPEGGYYQVRVEATDRFGNRIVAEASLFVSDENDEAKLRLLTDVSRLPAGIPAKVRLVQRGEPGWVLVTWEGQSELRWQVRRFELGSSDLVFTPSSDDVPGFVLAAAAIRGTKLITAQATFEVTRELRLAVLPRGDVVAPETDTTVELVTTDELGRPVQAEVSLAVVDEALLRRFPDKAPRLEGVFALFAKWDKRPFVTESSCDFTYTGRTREIAAAVLAEQRRQAAKQEFEARRAEVADSLRSLGYVAADSEMLDEAKVALKDAGDDEEEGHATGFGIGQGGGGGRGGSQTSGRRGGANRGFRSGETAFYSPSIVTGSNGRASVTFKLPDQATTWRLIARGITQDTRAGEGEAKLATRKDFFVELRAPALLVEGDAPRFVARLWHAPTVTGKAELRLRVTSDGRTLGSWPVELTLAGGDLTEHVFEALPAVPLAERLTVELVATATVDGAPRTATAARTIPVKPWGVEIADTRGGELTTSATFFLELPKETAWRSRRLDLFVGSGDARFLVDEALRRAPFTARDLLDDRLLTQADAAAELQGLCAVTSLVRARADVASAADAAALRSRAQSLLARLVATQQKDGGWPWAGAGVSDAMTSSLALAALGKARGIGLAVPADALDQGIRYVEQAFRGAAQQADEQKAMLLWALAIHERADFGALNRLHRQRASLSPAGLAYACLALVEANKGPMAAELATLIEQGAQSVAAESGSGLAAASCWKIDTNRPWNRSRIEMAALALLALERAAPRSPAIERGVQFLLQMRPWRPERAAGFVWTALAGWFADVAPEQAEATVRVRVNDRDVKALAFHANERGGAIPVPADLLVSGRQKVELSFEGRGRLSFIAALRGFTAEVVRQDRPDLRITRDVALAAAPRLRGRELTVGFKLLGDPPADAWENRVSELALGGLTNVEIGFVHTPAAGRDDGADPLILDVPLPAGAELLEGSVAGDFLSYAQRPGALQFQVGPTTDARAVRFTLVGRVPGKYRMLPATVRSSLDLERAARGDARSLTVLARGEPSTDLYRPTPDELYQRGSRLFDDGDRVGAAAALEPLLAQWADRLQETPFRAVARMLLYIALDRGDAAQIVRSFETLKEKDADFTLEFGPVLKVGAAYRRMEEHERALLLERALIEENFATDLQIAGVLEDEERYRDSFALIERLWLEYPDAPPVVQAYLGLSDQLLTLATGAAENKVLKAQGLDRLTLQKEGMRVLMRFLTFHSDDPIAPEAGLSLVTAWLALEDDAQASDLAGRLAARFEEPRFKDSFLYSKAVAEWAQQHDDVALKLLERIATADYVGADGLHRPSPNRALAWYIQAQIHHARRDAVKAAACYAEVAEEFQDAHEALAGLRERRLELPEVTLARPGAPATVRLESRNLAEAELLVYSVDLMTLCLREKNLARITNVNLAGVPPVLTKMVALEGRSALVPAPQEVALALDRPGAYLILCRAEEQHASGLVLVTPLDLQVTEEPDGGRVRTHVMRHADQGYVAGADVKAIGSDDRAFQSGTTDPRGLFVAGDLHGTATVIARLGDDQYAFWRGTTRLGAPQGQQREEQDQAADKRADKKYKGPGDSAPAGDRDAYFKNVLELNSALQNKRQEELEKELRKERKGVQIKQIQE